MKNVILQGITVDDDNGQGIAVDDDDLADGRKMMTVDGLPMVV
jgi:hypothetical protein